MRINKQIVFILFLLFNATRVFSQTIVLVDQKNNILTVDWDYSVTITLDRKTSLSFKSEKALILVPQLKCDSLIEIEISGPRIQTYYYQYYCEQFNQLDTIQLADRTLIKGQTPRLLLGKTLELDSIYNNQLWLKDWLLEYKDIVDGISFSVYNTEPLTKKEKRFVKQSIERYCQLIDKNEFRDKVFFKNECYTTGQEDLFNADSQITRSFIDNQNTTDMKIIAEKYSIVVTVKIEWKKQ
ncbi:MAG: hypothetical protein QE487_09265 [Fluviicola sp.]|nr:hypothetical protein [Fluviicola sp.]